MRHLVIKKLKTIIENCEVCGIPRYFGCPDNEYITDPEDLHMMTDEELLGCYTINIEIFGTV